ncbi:MAG: hypothetical protein ACW98Y_11760 [Candidatus Thorarchaeota archaeon]|jgi:hypothetical protein
MTEFYPKDKSVPEELVFDNIRIRQLRASDNELDYKAIIESGFRPEGFPQEENLKQIARHEEDHDHKKEFAFTILNVEETECYGCIFVKPLVPFLKYAFFNDSIIEHLALEQTDPGVSFWITPNGWKMNLYDKLLEELPKWFEREWPYESLYLFGMGPSKEEIKAISRFNLEQRFLLQIGNDKYILWKLI